MSRTCYFSHTEAREAGVEFNPVKRMLSACSMPRSQGCPSDDWDCDCPLEEVIVGYDILCPDGSTGYAHFDEGFQCKGMNQEILAWFEANLDVEIVS